MFSSGETKAAGCVPRCPASVFPYHLLPSLLASFLLSKFGNFSLFTMAAAPEERNEVAMQADDGRGRLFDKEPSSRLDLIE